MCQMVYSRVKFATNPPEVSIPSSPTTPPLPPVEELEAETTKASIKPSLTQNNSNKAVVVSSFIPIFKWVYCNGSWKQVIDSYPIHKKDRPCSTTI